MTVIPLAINNSERYTSFLINKESEMVIERLSFYRATTSLFVHLSNLSAHCPVRLRDVLFNELLVIARDIVLESSVVESDKDPKIKKQSVLKVFELLETLSLLSKLAHEAKAISDKGQGKIITFIDHIKHKGNNKIK